MEVLWAVIWEKFISITVSCRANTTARRHVINQGINIDIYAGLATTLYHINELAAIATATGELITDRLVASPPLAALDMLIGGDTCTAA